MQRVRDGLSRRTHRHTSTSRVRYLDGQVAGLGYFSGNAEICELDENRVECGQHWGKLRRLEVAQPDLGD